MTKWAIDIGLEPSGRDVEMEIEASDGREAVKLAMDRLEMRPGELLHTIFTHVSRPIAADGESA